MTKIYNRWINQESIKMQNLRSAVFSELNHLFIFNIYIQEIKQIEDDEEKDYRYFPFSSSKWTKHSSHYLVLSTTNIWINFLLVLLWFLFSFSLFIVLIITISCGVLARILRSHRQLSWSAFFKMFAFRCVYLLLFYKFIITVI